MRHRSRTTRQCPKGSPKRKGSELRSDAKARVPPGRRLLRQPAQGISRPSEKEQPSDALPAARHGDAPHRATHLLCGHAGQHDLSGEATPARRLQTIRAGSGRDCHRRHDSNWTQSLSPVHPPNHPQGEESNRNEEAGTTSPSGFQREGDIKRDGHPQHHRGGVPTSTAAHLPGKDVSPPPSVHEGHPLPQRTPTTPATAATTSTEEGHLLNEKIKKKRTTSKQRRRKEDIFIIIIIIIVTFVFHVFCKHFNLVCFASII